MIKMIDIFKLEPCKSFDKSKLKSFIFIDKNKHKIKVSNPITFKKIHNKKYKLYIIDELGYPINLNFTSSNKKGINKFINWILNQIEKPDNDKIPILNIADYNKKI